MPGKDVKKNYNVEPKDSSLQYSHNDLNQIRNIINELREEANSIQPPSASILVWSATFFGSVQPIENDYKIQANAVVEKFEILKKHLIQAKKNTRDQKKVDQIESLLTNIESSKKSLSDRIDGTASFERGLNGTVSRRR